MKGYQAGHQGRTSILDLSARPTDRDGAGLARIAGSGTAPPNSERRRTKPTRPARSSSGGCRSDYRPLTVARKSDVVHGKRRGSPNHDDRATGRSDEELTHRSEQHPRELTVTTATDAALPRRGRISSTGSRRRRLRPHRSWRSFAPLHTWLFLAPSRLSRTSRRLRILMGHSRLGCRRSHLRQGPVQ